MRRIVPFLILASVPPVTLATQTYRTDAAAPAAAIGFGSSVAIAGGHVLVGRAGLVPGFPMPPAQSGAIHLFRRGPEGWSEIAAEEMAF